MRLHPLSIPYRIFQSSPGLLGLLFVVSIAADQFQAGLLVPAAGVSLLVGFGAIIAWQFAYYRRFDYRLTPDTFDIRSGVISRRQREIPYRRVQNVDIARTMIQRMLGIAELRIETAGGRASEAHLRYVGYDEAKRLQEELRERTRDDEERGDDGETESPAGTLLYRISTSDLAVLSLASFDLRVASFLTVILSITAPSVIIGFILSAPIDPVAIVVAIGLVVVILSAVLSAASAIVNNYGFTLSRLGDELRYERGLLQRYDGSIPLDKVQTLVLQENVLMRVLGYASLTIETAGYGPGQGSAESAKAVPISERSRTVSIATRIESFEESTFRRPAKRARVRYTIRYVLLASALTAASFGVEWWLPFSFAWWVVVLGVPLAPIAAHYKWKHRGYALTDDHALLRSGFWRRRTHIVPYYRIQTVEEVQSILQRRWGIATVVVDTAGSSGFVSGDPMAYDLDEHDASELRQQLSIELQESLQLRKHRGAVDNFLSSAPDNGIRGTW